MRTPKCLISILVLAIVTSTLPAAEGGPSNARQASGVVRITADPDIVPLNPQTVEALLFSSAVAGEAVQDVLGRELKPEDREMIRIEWLSQGSRPTDTRADRVLPGEWLPPRSLPPMDTRSTSSKTSQQRGPDDEMHQELEEIYGAEYVRQFRDEMAERERTEKSSSHNRPSQPGAESRHKGGTGGGYGGMGMGGMGGGMGGGMMSGPYGEGYGMGGFGGMGGAMGGFGGMGGYGGTGAGMGGYGGGMMGGMGMGGMGMGMGGMYGGPAPAQTPGGEQTVTVRLSVDMPDDAKPAADKLLNALVADLRETLTDAYEKHAEQLRSLLEFAESQREYAQKRLLEAMGSSPEDRRRMQEQLNTYVDLSALSSEMSTTEAIDLLRNSVEPPLNIVVLWNDLGIEPSDAIDVSGLGVVMLRTALEVVVKALTHQLPSTYAVKDDVIVVGTENSVSRSAEVSQPPRVESDNRVLAWQSSALARQIQSLELDSAGLEARRQAIQEQIARVQKEADARLTQDAVTRELKTLMKTNEDHFALLRKQVDAGRASTWELSQANENLARARIELAKRQEELAASVGGNQLSDFNKELNEITIDMAGQKAQLEVLRRQINEVRQELAQVSAFSPEAARIRMAREMLDVIERRMAAIQTQLANLQPPAVTMIGAN